MKNGYKILWTDNALKELEKTIEYLEENWNETALQNLALNLEETLTLVSQNPNLFQVSDIKKRNSQSYCFISQYFVLQNWK
jgi:plasmid stabilization system protein ParE